MAELTPRRLVKSEINSGQRYTDNDGIQSLAVNAIAEAILYSDKAASDSLSNSETALSNSQTALTTADNSNTKSTTALNNSVTALSQSNTALSSSNTANENSQTARGLAQSVVDRANSGEFKGDKGESGINVPLAVGWFRVELRADGNLWVITPDGMSNPLKIQNNDLILTI